jgi:hypothetical protein
MIIRIKNGIAESVEDIPTDMTVEVRNSDVTNMGEDQLTRDGDGPRRYGREWRSPE